MKRKAMHYSMMLATFMLVTQLFAFAPVSQAGQSERRQRTYSMRVDPSAQPGTRRMRRRGQQNWCYRRCRREYSRCLSWAGGNMGRRRACAVRYRNCVRRCSY